MATEIASGGPASDVSPRRVRGAGYSVEFNVGQRCLIQFEWEGQKYRSVIIGFEPYQFVIARLPRTPGIMNRLRPGNALIVRLEHAGTVYGFTTEILNISLKPAPLVVFAFPESVEGLRFRQQKRTQCLLPARLVNEFLQTDGLVSNVSTGGCRLLIDWRDKNQVFNIMTGDSLELAVHLDGQGPLAIPSTVMNVKELKRHYTMGLKFAGEDWREPLAGFIDRLEGAWTVLEDGSERGF